MSEPTRSKLPRHIDRLYKAVANYVRFNGGSVVVIGGVQLMEWPGDTKMKFSIVVKCRGRKPVFREPA